MMDRIDFPYAGRNHVDRFELEQQQQASSASGDSSSEKGTASGKSANENRACHGTSPFLVALRQRPVPFGYHVYGMVYG